MRHTVGVLLGSIFALILVIAMINTPPIQRTFSEMNWYVPPSIGSCLSLTPSEVSDATRHELMMSEVDCDIPDSRIHIIGTQKSDCDPDIICGTFNDRNTDFYFHAVPHVGLCFFGYEYFNQTASSTWYYFKPSELSECGEDFQDQITPEEVTDEWEVDVSALKPVELRIDDIGDDSLTCPYPLHEWNTNTFEAIETFCVRTMRSV